MHDVDCYQHNYMPLSIILHKKESMTYIDFIVKNYYTAAKKILLDKGKRVELNKGELLCHIGERTSMIGLVGYGALKYSCLNSCGHERIISFAFSNDLVGSYSSIRNEECSIFDIIALENTLVYQLSIKEIDAAIDHKYRMEFAEALSYQLLQKVIENCCMTVEERYSALLKRLPDIHNRMTNRTIAAYLGITPESLSRVRKRLLTDF